MYRCPQRRAGVYSRRFEGKVTLPLKQSLRLAGSPPPLTRTPKTRLRSFRGTPYTREAWVSALLHKLVGGHSVHPRFIQKLVWFWSGRAQRAPTQVRASPQSPPRDVILSERKRDEVLVVQQSGTDKTCTCAGIYEGVFVTFHRQSYI